MGRFTGKLNIYMSILPPLPTLNLNFSPQQKNSSPTKKYVVSCYFDRIWLLTIASCTNKYAFTLKKWTNNKFPPKTKNISSKYAKTYAKTHFWTEKILHQNFQLQPPPLPPLPPTHTQTHKYTHKHATSIYLENHVTYSYRYSCIC